MSSHANKSHRYFKPHRYFKLQFYHLLDVDFCRPATRFFYCIEKVEIETLFLKNSTFVMKLNTPDNDSLKQIISLNTILMSSRCTVPD